MNQKATKKQGAMVGDEGFTLVELLVALALLGMLAVLLAAGLRVGQRAWNSSEERSEAARVMHDAQAALRRLLETLQPIRTGQDRTAPLLFNGEASVLEGVIHLPPHLGRGGFYRVRLQHSSEFRRFQIVFTVYDAKSGRASGDGSVTVLAEQVDHVELRYFGKSKDDSGPRWSPSWRQQGDLPSLIAIRVDSARPGGAWPELLIAPRIHSVEWRQQGG